MNGVYVTYFESIMMRTDVNGKYSNVIKWKEMSTLLPGVDEK